VALGLHEAAHNTIHRMQTTITGVRRQARDDGMVWSFSGCQHIRMILIEAEVRTAVLERKATALGNDAGAETAVVAVDERDGVSFGVRTAEIYCVALEEPRWPSLV
jgi:hypothetical protein